MDDWSSYLPNNGSKALRPSLPSGSMLLDSTIESSGLGANSLYGNFESSLGIGNSKKGGGYVRIDSPNKRIIINDGYNDRVIVGFLGEV